MATCQWDLARWVLVRDESWHGSHLADGSRWVLAAGPDGGSRYQARPEAVPRHSIQAWWGGGAGPLADQLGDSPTGHHAPEPGYGGGRPVRPAHRDPDLLHRHPVQAAQPGTVSPGDQAIRARLPKPGRGDPGAAVRQ